MTKNIEFKYFTKPDPIKNYLRFIFLKRSGLKTGQELPEMKFSMPAVKIDTDLLKRYNEACGLKEQSAIPVLFPHVLASPLFMAMLSHKSFPLRLIGALHLRNHIVQYRPVRYSEVFNIIVYLQKKRIVAQGLEFDFTIELRKEHELLWKSVSTMMKRGKFGIDFEESPRAGLIVATPDAATYKELYIPKGIGKKFAEITSDYNPIHLSRIMAMLFGFKRDIVHGMWASAQALGVLPAFPKKNPLRVDLAFKGPLYIDNPSRITLKTIRKGYRFDYFCADNPRPCIQGKVTAVGLKEMP